MIIAVVVACVAEVGAKVQLFVCAHKHFRRNVSKSPFFLIKVKDIYIPVTKTGYF